MKAGEDNPQARDEEGKTNIYEAWSTIHLWLEFQVGKLLLHVKIYR